VNRWANRFWIGALVLSCFLLGASCQMVFDEQTGDNQPSWKQVAQGTQAQNDSLFALNTRLYAANQRLAVDNDTLCVRLVTALIAQSHWRKLAIWNRHWPTGRELKMDPGGVLWIIPPPISWADSVNWIPL